jgi:hypothetical protein
VNPLRDKFLFMIPPLTELRFMATAIDFSQGILQHRQELRLRNRAISTEQEAEPQGSGPF